MDMVWGLMRKEPSDKEIAELLSSLIGFVGIVHYLLHPDELITYLEAFKLSLYETAEKVIDERTRQIDDLIALLRKMGLTK